MGRLSTTECTYLPNQVTDYMEQNTPAVGCVMHGQLVQQTIYHKP